MNHFNLVDFLDKKYTSTNGNNIVLKKYKIYSALRFIIRLIANIIIPIHYILTSEKKSHRLDIDKNKHCNIIVSLTSFPRRISKVWIVIESILRQSKKPDMIILWLSNEQFKSKESLPFLLQNQQKRGLQIRFVDDNLSSHKKYYYVIKEFPNYNIITIDDDILYRSKMIEDLFNYSKRYPKTVIAQYGLEILWNGDELLPYCKWSIIKNETTPNYNVFFGSGGGTFFPPNSLFKDILYKKLFLSITPTADDIWLNAMCRLNKIKIVKTKYSSLNLPILYTKKINLYKINIGENMNDIQIAKVRDYYNINQGIDPFICSKIY